MSQSMDYEREYVNGRRNSPWNYPKTIKSRLTDAVTYAYGGVLAITTFKMFVLPFVLLAKIGGLTI